MLLKQYISLSEELLSIQLEDDWPQMDGFFSERETVIQQLQNLDRDNDKTIIASCSPIQNAQIDQLVSLILEVDKNIEDLIKKERDKILESMKSNTHEQKIADYAAIENPNSAGKYLDIKK